MTLSLQGNSSLSPALRYWELLHVLVVRNLKVRYRGSIFGVYWSLLSPLMMTGVYAAIFGTKFASYYGNSILNYVLAAFVGMVAINFFDAATSQALISIVENGPLLNKIRLPISIFPVSMVSANLFQFTIAVLPFLALITLLTSKSLVNVLALFVPLLGLTLVCTGIGFLSSALYVFFRDFHYFYELVKSVIWISTPIFYPSDIVPPQVRQLLSLNPLSVIIESIRQIVLSGLPPNISFMVSALLSGVLTATLGWLCFQGWRNQFIDLL